MTPSLDSINLLEELRELWKTFYLIDDGLLKGYNSETVRWKDAQGISKDFFVTYHIYAFLYPQLLFPSLHLYPNFSTFKKDIRFTTVLA